MTTKIACFEAGEMPQQAKLHADDLSSMPLHTCTHTCEHVNTAACKLHTYTHANIFIGLQ